MQKNYDFIIVGAGIIGLTLARRLASLHPKASLLIIEKEKEAGVHASGRNSGVLHAGFYYSADSMKAKFTRQGNLGMHAFCEEQGLPINRCGKLVVAKDADEDQRLDLLAARGQANAVPLELLDLKQAREVEPRVKTFARALFSPTTSSVDPVQVVQRMAALVQSAGCEISYDEAFLAGQGAQVITDKRVLSCGYLINCAGTYADKIAHGYGVGLSYSIMPFKGIYLYSEEQPGALRTNIYPVPDLKMPFLGVHFTLTVDKHIKIGPTAIPALWNEQYTGMENFSLKEFLHVCRLGSQLMWKQEQFRRLAASEACKIFRKRLVSLAGDMAENINLSQYQRWGRPGIRAQLLHLPTKKLEMDFVVEKGERSLHVLNAVSPAFTCSLPIADYLCEQLH